MSVKVKQVTDEMVILEALVTPFSEERDLHGDRFSKETYFGDDLVKEKFVFMGHLTDPSTPFPDNILGKAVFNRIDDRGRWFDIQISKHHKYAEYIQRLAEMGVLGTSSQAFKGGAYYRKDAEKEIAAWLEGEVTLTTTPAAFKTVEVLNQVNEVRKSFSLPELVPMEEAPKSETPPQATPQQTDSLEQQLQELVKEEIVAPVTPVDTNSDAILAALNSVSQKIDALAATPKPASVTPEELQKQVNFLQDFTQKAVVSLANYIKELRKIEVASELPPVVKAVAEDVINKRPVSKFPPHAPGSN